MPIGDEQDVALERARQRRRWAQVSGAPDDEVEGPAAAVARHAASHRRSGLVQTSAVGLVQYGGLPESVSAIPSALVAPMIGAPLFAPPVLVTPLFALASASGRHTLHFINIARGKNINTLIVS
jgi:hypothetical protein